MRITNKLKIKIGMWLIVMKIISQCKIGLNCLDLYAKYDNATKLDLCAKYDFRFMFL